MQRLGRLPGKWEAQALRELCLNRSSIRRASEQSSCLCLLILQAL